MLSRLWVSRWQDVKCNKKFPFREFFIGGGLLEGMRGVYTDCVDVSFRVFHSVILSIAKDLPDIQYKAFFAKQCYKNSLPHRASRNNSRESEPLDPSHLLRMTKKKLRMEREAQGDKKGTLIRNEKASVQMSSREEKEFCGVLRGRLVGQ